MRRALPGGVLLAGLVSLAACSSALGTGGSGDPGSVPSTVLVGFKVGVPRAQAKAEVRSCHPLSIFGVNTARLHGQSATTVTIWAPRSGTARAAALYKCLKTAPGVAVQNWAG